MDFQRCRKAETFPWVSTEREVLDILVGLALAEVMLICEEPWIVGWRAIQVMLPQRCGYTPGCSSGLANHHTGMAEIVDPPVCFIINPSSKGGLMKEVVCLILLSVVLVSPGFVESFTPHSSSVLITSGTHSPASSTPDCRIQTC